MGAGADRRLEIAQVLAQGLLGVGAQGRRRRRLEEIGDELERQEAAALQVLITRTRSARRGS
ncbi:MAG: hypothetical protein HS111_15265 [Kofleriaceae bacterium]|nr:hypothetical protein [Kofleriaceae bacterium]